MFWETLRTRITESLLARRVDRWITVAIAVLLVACGFTFGRWTALTSRATPIMFQEAPGTTSSEASPEELNALVAGASRAPKEPTAPSGQSRKEAPAVTSPGKVVASANGEKYYFADCLEVRRIKEENRVWFDSEEEAKESGYEPSMCVQRRRG